MFEIVFVDRETDRVNYAITGITLIRHITPTEVSYVTNVASTVISFPETEKLEVNRVE